MYVVCNISGKLKKEFIQLYNLISIRTLTFGEEDGLPILKPCIVLVTVVLLTAITEPNGIFIEIN